MRFDNKVALITGASSGLGAATARQLASEGASVFAIGRNEEALKALTTDSQPLAGTVEAFVCDLLEDQACQSSVDRCVETFGKLDVLINCAGVHTMRPLPDIQAQDWEQDLALNLSVPFRLCQAAMTQLLDTGGNIVNVCSIAGLQGQAYSAGYCAAKHGLIGLTRALALEYMKTGIRINALCPGGMDTPQVRNFQFPEAADFELVMRASGVRPMMEAETVAKAIAFLASDDAAGIHGAVQTVDAGKTVG